MGFESGNVSFRVYYMSRPLPDDHIARFARHAAPGLDDVGRDPGTGWVTGRHLLDRNISEASAYLAGYLRLTLMKAERKVPMPLLRAECMIEELAELQASEKDVLPRAERVRIRKEVMDRLLPSMPPQLSGIPVVCGRNDDVLFASALADKQMDALSLAFSTTQGIELTPVNPETASLKRKQFSPRQLAPASFSPDCTSEEVPDHVGLDFLTWLWFYAEERGGMIETDQGEFGVMLDGPLLFVMEGGGAHEIRLSRGSPLSSHEANTALRNGKKLRRARVILARGEESWRAEVDAADFAFRGLKLPKVFQYDAASLFQDRMLSIRTYVSVFLSLYDRFIEERMQVARWESVCRDMQAWVAGRAGSR